MATLRDIAEAAGVSIDTVSRALNGKNKGAWASTARRSSEIHRIAQELNYRPSAAARAVRSSRTRMIGALMRNNPRDPHIHPVAFEALLGLNHGLEAAGYVLSVIRFDDVQFAASAGSRVFREQMLDGMVIIGGMPQEAVSRLEQLVPLSIWANTNVWRDECCIRRDEVHTGRLAAQSLIEMGYRRLVLLGGVRGSVPHYSHDDRFAGLKQGAGAAGAQVERVGIPWTPVMDARELSLSLLQPEVAILTDGTEWAQWVVNAANGLGKIPGRDFGLACCDESSEICRYWPGLSRVSFDHYAMGTEAARMILQRLEKPGEPCSSKLFRGQWLAGNTAVRGSAGESGSSNSHTSNAEG